MRNLEDQAQSHEGADPAFGAADGTAIWAPRDPATYSIHTCMHTHVYACFMDSVLATFFNILESPLQHRLPFTTPRKENENIYDFSLYYYHIGK